jgi:hypothetical protein
MKNHVFSFMALFSCMICISTFANAQTVERPDYRHWSLGAQVGFTRVPTSGGQIFSGSEYYNYLIKGDVEYTFNPYFGAALEYTYIRYNFPVEYPAITWSDRYLETAKAHELLLIGNINMTNLLFKYRGCDWQRLNVYLFAGAGLSLYRNTEDLPDYEDILGDVKGNNGDLSLSIPYGLTISYAVSKCVDITLTGDRRWHSGYTSGVNWNVNGTKVWTFSGGLRFKFGGRSSQHKHIKNTTAVSYDEIEAARYSPNPQLLPR